MKKHRHEEWIGYLVAVLGTGAAVALRWALEPWSGSRLVAFGVLYLTVAWTAGFRRRSPALVATLLGCLAVEHSIIGIETLFSPTGYRGILIFAIFALSCAWILALAEAKRRAVSTADRLRSDIVAKHRRLGAEIAGREAAEADAKTQAEKFRAMADSAPVLIWMSGPESNLNWYNRPWLEFVGRTLEEEQNVEWGENIHELDYDRCVKEYQDAFAHQRPFSLEYRLRRHDGQHRWVIDNGVPLYDPHGNFTGFIGSCIDIHDRKVAEDTARAADEKAARVLESIDDVFLSLDRENRYVYVNSAAEKYYGKSREEMLGKTPWEVFPVYREGKNKELLFRLLDRSEVRHEEMRSIVTGRWIQYSTYPTEDGVSFLIHDVTERRLAQQAIESKEAQLRLITDAVPAMIAYVDQEGRFQLANRAYADWFGLAAADFAGKHVSEVFGPQLYAVSKPHVEAALSGREAHFEALSTKADVGDRWLQAHFVPDVGAGGSLRGFVTLVQDVTDQRKFQDTLQYQSDLLRTITENAQSMLVLLDGEGRVTFANSACEAMLGRKPSELVGQSFRAIVQPRNRDGSTYLAEENPIAAPHPSPEPVHNLEDVFFRKDGSSFPVRCSASRITRNTEVVASVLEIQDITEEKRSIAALEESEARFQSFMNHSPALSWIKDENGRYIFVNEALQKLNGWRRRDWLGKTDFEIYPQEVAATYRVNDEIVLSDGKVRQFKEQIFEKDATRQLLAIKFPMQVGEGRWHIGGMAIDVTDSIRAEEALRASEARFQAFMEFTPAISWIKNQAGQYVFVNRAMRKTFGWAPKDCAMKVDLELFPPDVADRLRAHDEAVLAKGDVIEFVDVIPSTSGPRHFLFVSFPMRVGEGQWHVGGKAIDITDRVEAEEALARSERELNDFFENAAIGLHWVGRDGTILRANRTELEMLGYSREDYVGRNIRDFHVDEAEIGDILARLSHGESLDNFPAAMRCKDGAVKDVLITSNSLFERGEFVHSRCFTRDVTQEKRAMRALQESEERFRFLAETIPSIVWTAAPDGSITYANKHWLEFCGISEDENRKRWPELVLHPEDFDRCVDKWTRALREGTEYEIEVRNRRHDGEYRWFVTRAVPIRDESGNVKSWFGVTTDIHDLKVLQEQLREADRRKDEFLATLAHELRNPLAPIRNAVHLLKSDADRPRQEQNIEIIDRQISQMVRLVDDLLEASRLSRGKLELRKSVTELKSAIDSAVTSSRPAIEAMGHRLEVVLPSEPVQLYADTFRLAQVFSNLLNNAAKYTEPGGRITLTVERKGEFVQVSVRDSGLGIDKATLEHIFDMFFQARSAIERTDGGLGIGLSLVKTLVELHGGTIEAFSEGSGKGSEFVVRLPTRIPDDAHSDKAAVLVDTPSPARRLRVLVVDDNVDSAHTLSMLLELMGHQTETALDGLEAIRSIDRLRPDVVLLDIGLPEINGYDVARKVREKPWGDEVRLIALSGWGQESDKQKAKDAGFDLHLTKPVDFTTLEGILGSVDVKGQV